MNDTLVEIISTQSIVSSSRLDFDLRLVINLIDFKDRDVKCTTAEIEYKDGLIIFFVHTIR